MRLWSRWIGVTLLVVFAAFAFFQYRFLLGRFDSNPDLLGQLATAEFLEPEPLEDGDWPLWRGLRRDGQAKPFPLLDAWPGKPTWSVPVGEGWGAGAVADGKVYCLSRQDGSEVLRCLSLEDGSEVWKESYTVLTRFDHGNGPRSTPCVADGMVYTVGITGIVQCRKSTDGKLVWEKHLDTAYNAEPPKWGVAFSPLVEGDLVILNPGAAGASVVACKRDTGAEVWRWGSDPVGYSSPQTITLGGQKLVLMFTGTALVGLRLGEGTEVFRHPWPTDHQINAPMPLLFRTKQGDAIHEYAFISTGYWRGFALLHLRSRQDATVEIRTVYSGDSFCSHYSSPVRIGDHIYGFDETKLTSLNLRTGEVSWKQSGYKKGNLCAVGDDLIVVGEEGKLGIGKATPNREFAPRLQTNLPGSRFEPIKYWTMPVVAQGRLLLRGGGKMLCYDLRGGS